MNDVNQYTNMRTGSQCIHFITQQDSFCIVACTQTAKFIVYFKHAIIYY